MKVLVIIGLLAIMAVGNGDFTEQVMAAPDANVWCVRIGGGAATAPCRGNIAYPTIQAAIAKTASGDEIRIAQGTYTGAGQQVVSINNKVLTLYGGFSGTDWTTSVATNTTIIDAQNSRRGIYLTNAIGIFDSLTIQNGNTASIGTSQGGGGIALESSVGTLPLYLFNTTIKNNTATGSGGGVFVFGGKITAVDSQFINNSAFEDGGGVYGPSVYNGVLFRGNVANRYGGGAVGGSITRNSTFIDNLAKRGSGGGLANNGDILVENSLFRNNTAAGAAGLAQIFSQNYTVTIKNSLFEGNTAKMQPDDDTQRCECSGAIGVEGNLILDSVVVRNNIAKNSSGGINQWWMTSGVTITNSLIEGNKALTGTGGAGVIGGRLTVTNSTIFNNSAYLDGGGLYQFEQSNGRRGISPVTIRNSAIISNTAITGAGGGLYTNEDTTFADVVIAQNHAGKDGGGLYMNNWDPFFTPHVVTLSNVRFMENEADGDGGAIFARAYEMIIRGSQLLANHAHNNGGGIHTSVSNALIQGSVFGNNRADMKADGLYSTDTDFAVGKEFTFSNVTFASAVLNPHTAIEFATTRGAITMTNTLVTSHTLGIQLSNPMTLNGDYNNFFGNTTNYQIGTTATALPWTHTFALAPQFINPANDDFHLQDTSPLINIGDPDMNYTGMRDIDGMTIPLQNRAEIGGDEFFFVTDRIYLPLMSR